MDQSPLVRLSCELRDRVYSLVVCQADKLLIYIIDDKLYLLPAAPRRNFLAITATCKKIHRESTLTFYTRNTFLISSSAFDDVWQPRDDKATSTAMQSNDILRNRRNRERFVTEEAFHLKQNAWSDSVRKWLDDIGPRNASDLRKVEISVGIWHLQKSTEYEGLVASGLQMVVPRFHDTPTECTVSMRIGVPSPGSIPCIVDLSLPTTKDKALDTLKELFNGKFGHLDRLWSQNKISPISYQILKRDTTQCWDRLKQFVLILTQPAPKWTEQDSKELETLLHKWYLDSCTQKWKPDRRISFQPRKSAEEKEVVPRGDSPDWEDVGSDEEPPTGYIGPPPRITCIREVQIAREARDRQYSVLPVPIALRNRELHSPVPLRGETITTITSPKKKRAKKEWPWVEYSEEDAVKRVTMPAKKVYPSRILKYWEPSGAGLHYGV